MNAARLSLALFVLCLLNCSEVHIKTDHNKKYDLAQFTTFSWFSAQSQANILNDNPVLRNYITEAIETNLTSKGLRVINVDSSDLMIAIHAGIQDRIQSDSWSGEGTYHPWWGPYGSQVDTRYYEEGTLVIDMVLTEKSELVWRGLGTGALKNYDSQEKMNDAIREYVNRILKSFPPK